MSSCSIDWWSISFTRVVVQPEFDQVIEKQKLERILKDIMTLEAEKKQEAAEGLVRHFQVHLQLRDWKSLVTI